MKKYNIHINPEAYDDLSDIAEDIYLASKSIPIAKKYVKGILSTINDLSKFGGSLALCQNKSITDVYGKFVRKENYKKVSIIYAVDDDDIYILKIQFAYSITGL